MKRTFLSLVVLLMLTLSVFNSCEKQQEEQKQEMDYVNPDQTLDLDLITQSVVNLMQDPQANDLVLDLLKDNKHGISMEEASVVLQNDLSSEKLDQFDRVVWQSKEVNAKIEEHGVIEVPELWLYKPNQTVRSQDVLFAYAPVGEESKWETIKAYNLRGEEVYLDAFESPEVPVVIIEPKGHKALELKVDFMNLELTEQGAFVNQEQSFKSTAGLETTVLKSIRMTDVKEPWIKGAAEIYAVTSGIRTNNGRGEPQVKIIALPYLDDENKTYYPDQVMLVWSDYAYQAANIQFFEEDSKYNYKELTSIIVSGIFQIAALVSEQPWVSVLGQIAGQIIKVMPDEWYTDDDDYVDSFYTIMKDKKYYNKQGSAGITTVNLEPLFIPAN